MENPLAVQWLEPSTLTAKSLGSILGWGAKKPHKPCGVLRKKKKKMNYLWNGLKMDIKKQVSNQNLVKVVKNTTSVKT